MKNILLSISFLSVLTITSSAQPWANASLDINQAKALVNSNGDLFWDYTQGRFEVPKGNGTNTILAGALWIGGLDVGGQLKVAAQTYRQTGNDFYPGPIMNVSSYSTANDVLWNRVWKINRSTIDSFRLGLFSIVPNEIATWPGNGDVAQGQAVQLADYVDIDGDQIYDPSAGDYPCIKGDQAVFVIFNDGRNIHTETGGQPLNVEFHMMLYAYKAPGTYLDTVVFLNYKMFYRGTVSLTNAYIGSWMDLNLGYGADDYVGCDVGRDMFYVYNGDADDGSSSIPSQGTFGTNPPAQGVIFLRGPVADLNDGVDNDHDGTIDEIGEFCTMSKFGYYNNDFTITGNPVTAADHYGYMSGFWKDGAPFTYGGNAYGGTEPADFVFPEVSDPFGYGTNGNILNNDWNEVDEGFFPGDRRGLASSGPFVLLPGAQMCLDFAFVYGRGAGGPLSSVENMQIVADRARTFYNGTSPCSCAINPLAVNEISNKLTFQFYPNPTSDNITISYQPGNGNAVLEIYDMTGKMVGTEIITKASTVVDMKKFTAGIYLLRIADGKSSGAAKILKQ